MTVPSTFDFHSSFEEKGLRFSQSGMGVSEIREGSTRLLSRIARCMKDCRYRLYIRVEPYLVDRSLDGSILRLDVDDYKQYVESARAYDSWISVDFWDTLNEECIEKKEIQTVFNMKSKIRGRSGNPLGYKLGLPQVLLCCAIFFFAGYYGSNTFFQEEEEQVVVDPLTRDKVVLDHGITGDSSLTDIPFQVLSWNPRALMFPNFASKKQCEAIIKLAKTRLAPSGLALRKGETADTTKEIRTSSGTFLRADEDKSRSLEAVEVKMARATMIPRINGEAFNVLRYNLGQKYDCHYDVFDPAEYGPQPSQRMASFLLYLSDVEEGGETMFPFENFQNMKDYDYKECIGLKVKPRQGDALLFYSIHPNGTFDKTALHGSCPVIKGEKWVATKWIRNTARF